MASEDPDPMLDPELLDEQLVAYLDGELDEETGRRIETLAASDSQVRERLERLGRTWDLLGELSGAEVSGQFTETTLEMVAVAAEDEVRARREALPRLRRRRWALAGGSLLAAGAIGFFGVALLRPDPNRQLLRDLPVLENLDEYRQVDSIEFLRALREANLFPEDPPDEP
jgi:anti-sigma factor RsiW